MSEGIRIANKLKELMAEKNLRLVDLARSTGIKAQQISRYLKGQEPERETLSRLAEPLGVKIEVFYKGEPGSGQERLNENKLAAIRAVLAATDREMHGINAAIAGVLARLSKQDQSAG